MRSFEYFREVKLNNNHYILTKEIDLIEKAITLLRFKSLLHHISRAVRQSANRLNRRIG